MEVAVAEEKKKIFRARKTMKVSDRQQLETLHSTLSPSGQPSSNSSSPLGPLLNGTHREDGRKGSSDKELNDTDSKSPRSTTPVSSSSSSRGSHSPAPLLSLKLSPSPPLDQSPKYNDDGAAAASPASPFHSLNFELKKMEEEGRKVCSPPPSNGCPASPLKEAKEGGDEETEAANQNKKDEETLAIQKEETKTTKEDLASESVNKSKPSPPASPSTSDRKSDKDQKSKLEDTVAMETDIENSKPKTSEASTVKEAGTSSPKPTSSSSPSSSLSSTTVPEKDQKVKEEKDIKGDKNEKKDVKLKSLREEKMDVDAVQRDFKKEGEEGVDSKCSRPSSTPPSGVAVKEEKRPPTGLKRTLSEGDDYGDGVKLERDGKRPKVQGVELEAQLELKITAKAGSRLKLEKVVQQMVEERLKELQLTVFDQNFQELKDRVEKIDCANRHQSTLLTLQAKVARLAKKFGEANQANENKKKQQCSVELCSTRYNCASPSNSVLRRQPPDQSAPSALSGSPAPPVGRAPPLSVKKKREVVEEDKEDEHLSTVPKRQGPSIADWITNKSEGKCRADVALRTLANKKEQVLFQSLLSSQAQPKPNPPSLTTTSSAAMVTQSNILQLITTSAANASTLGTITSQSPTGTLLLKTASGGAMMSQGQPLLIQLPLSMANGQPGTLVNIPVSSFTAAGNNNPLNKVKASAPATSTATFIIKAAPSSTLTTTTASATSSMVPMLQASTVQMSPSQVSATRNVYQGGAGAISTPNAGGVSVTSARTPAHTVALAGAMSSSSSPAASGPAATGSTAPGPPKGTALTSKTDNQVTGSTPTKSAVPGSRPKGSVIDLTEDDDDVQVHNTPKKASPAKQTLDKMFASLDAELEPEDVPGDVPDELEEFSEDQESDTHPHNPEEEPGLQNQKPEMGKPCGPTCRKKCWGKDTPLKTRPANTATPTTRTTSATALPPLPLAPLLTARLPPDAQQTSPPQQPQLKLVQGPSGIVLSWCVSETDRNCAAVESYHLYAYHNDNLSSGGSAVQQQQQQQHWKKIGEVKALPLPMACTLTQFQSGSTYHFAVRARDVHGRFGSFCEPQCTNVINSS
ncbi:activating transcription factor 7-interacting protein 1 [Aplochiton taeniatus]